ncbi:hypothetical protein [Haloquadratum walsbyi]|uniref:Uncharacterized protein n=1 Tax=Haloquadratum walsbyi J07HQW2 TaxID=1238425 RepID=U1NJT7_9EURY|nr:hypothetical protein [Haloquadratum walsbyi]ERG97218.1 MAG: hypothetical protein J07HQW2_03704 [Haloquadratum walsbyi J07HQW2]
MTLERYYFVADRAHPEHDSATLHAEHDCHHIDSLSENRLAVISGDGARLRDGGLFLQCLNCTDGDDGVVPNS